MRETTVTSQRASNWVWVAGDMRCQETHVTSPVSESLPVRGRQLWRRTGNFLLIFLQFYVYDFRFKVWGPKTFLAEFQTLDITVMISLDDTVLYHRLGCVMIQSEITGYCIHHNNEKCNINPIFNYHLMHWGRDKMAAIFQTFLMHFLMKIYQICLKWVKTPMFYLGKKLLGPNRTRLHLIPWKIIH